MSQKVVIAGGGAFGREVLDVIEAINHHDAMAAGYGYDVIGVLDTAPPERYDAYGVDYLGGDELLEQLPRDVGFVVGVGSPRLRARLAERGMAAGRTSPVLVHPSATIGRSVTLGPGTIICSHVSITNHVTLGQHVHVNLNATIGHDTTVDDFCTISPLVAVSGHVRLERGSYLGTHSSVNENLTVGEWAVVGAGAAVVRDVPPSVTAVGVPAKVR